VGERRFLRFGRKRGMEKRLPVSGEPLEFKNRNPA